MPSLLILQMFFSLRRSFFYYFTRQSSTFCTKTANLLLFISYSGDGANINKTWGFVIYFDS